MPSESQPTARSTETLDEIASEVIRLLAQANETVGVAESLTGGGLMAALTSVPGASAVFRGGVVSYATPLKQELLDVDRSLIHKEGVIHHEVASQMAAGARKITTVGAEETTWGVGTTGVAGPSSQDGKPPGTVYIDIASAKESCGHGPYHFPGVRKSVRTATVMEALALLRSALRSSEVVKGSLH
ncbi:hypothetical protein CSUB01_09033 [Colletotrichum sublineola]|uniref:CinA C-terminal domain-containing protein n=1 Tax=Colletotrichum sublineola TaxID=1173701 RepID=A0A066X4H8_COLSU|nr:hypothetical protein CSUB01_09033 [Colletotrichum sublineola]